MFVIRQAAREAAREAGPLLLRPQTSVSELPGSYLLRVSEARGVLLLPNVNTAAVLVLTSNLNEITNGGRDRR